MAKPLTDAITALTTYANTVTGASDTTLSEAVATLASGYGGGSSLSWLASETPTPSVRNFFYALVNGTVEHGEVSFANVPNTFIDVFTLTNITEPQGIIFIDKDFYQGATGLLNNSSEAVGFCWMDKAFLNPAQRVEGVLKYVGVKTGINQTGTASSAVGNINFVVFDGNTTAWRARFQFVGKTLQVKNDYNNNNQYCFFMRNRTYIWIAYE